MAFQISHMLMMTKQLLNGCNRTSNKRFKESVMLLPKTELVANDTCITIFA